MILTIARDELARIALEASAGLPPAARARVLETAATTNAVAFGHNRVHGVACIGSQAGCRKRAFRRAFDTALIAHFAFLDIFVDEAAVAILKNEKAPGPRDARGPGASGAPWGRCD